MAPSYWPFHPYLHLLVWPPRGHREGRRGGSIAVPVLANITTFDEASAMVLLVGPPHLFGSIAYGVSSPQMPSEGHLSLVCSYENLATHCRGAIDPKATVRGSHQQHPLPDRNRQGYSWGLSHNFVGHRAVLHFFRDVVHDLSN